VAAVVAGSWLKGCKPGGLHPGKLLDTPKQFVIEFIDRAAWVACCFCGNE